ncbi:hypothetical protein [Mastigocoleus testarum]|uniref:Uncharacterized protein n=1 Tax=Mastigocoleus testarum BC008 TaxID=371196 RepID=A0A0V7ZL92_9CYAN|nr:hypothetical protein [Mastigocoleus testarum]KST65408.1 hypothetical protein BC008_21705 [Mastigocoleus testarum BC008]KST70472.1 hypothetical protein BC008_45655 [Mastigocoleus testarum BC008]
MQKTLELRWFVKGIPPTVVRHWFEVECPGELFPQVEVREDLYFHGHVKNFQKFRLLNLDLRRDEEFNLKSRQGNLELKLQQQELGTRDFSNIDGKTIWKGNIEQWCKWVIDNLESEFYLNSIKIIPKNYWIPVHKERQQRQIQDVKSELTLIRVENSLWWSIAFEMIQDEKSRQKDSYFYRAINLASQTYCGPELSTHNSYGYSRWLLQLKKGLLQTIP